MPTRYELTLPPNSLGRREYLQSCLGGTENLIFRSYECIFQVFLSYFGYKNEFFFSFFEIFMAHFEEYQRWIWRVLAAGMEVFFARQIGRRGRKGWFRRAG